MLGVQKSKNESDIERYKQIQKHFGAFFGYKILFLQQIKGKVILENYVQKVEQPHSKVKISEFVKPIDRSTPVDEAKH